MTIASDLQAHEAMCLADWTLVVFDSSPATGRSLPATSASKQHFAVSAPGTQALIETDFVNPLA
jgi:hypothetical protein